MDEHGEIMEWLGSALDLTARKAAEDALHEADRRKDEFLATLAHELRNPLAPLRNGLQYVRINSPPDVAFQRTLQLMDRQLNMLMHLVDDLLDVSRINTGKIELRREPVTLREVLAASAETSRAAIDARGHHLVIDLGAAELPVQGDPDRLIQVFSNLLSNAAKYTERSGTIELRAARERDEAVVSVADTGIGIAASDLPNLFTIFAQVHSQRGRAEGLGIGLSLVRQLVELHGGTVQVASPGVGRGSTFTVRLPLTQLTMPAAAERGAVDTNERAAPRQRVLVVDDNEDAATSLALLLEHLGHEAVTACDGEDAIAKAEALRPHVVFLDLGMPRMDGIEAAKRLRALPDGGALVLIALTGWGHERDLERTRSAGFNRHLLKPIEPDSLNELFRSLAVTV